MRPGWPPWIPWAELATYLAGFVIAARVMFAATTPGKSRGKARGLAFLAGLLWPLAFAAMAIAGLVMLPTLGMKTRHDRAVEAETAKWEQEKRAGRIAELEAENERLRQAAEGHR